MNKELQKRYQLYNSLFLNLYYQESNHVGHLLPLLKRYAKGQIDIEKNPTEIIDSFWEANKEVIGKNKIDFMFHVIQYVERQIVLFDSLEDSISPKELSDEDVMTIKDIFTKYDSQQDQHDLMKKLNEFKVRIVLTAHPTQFYRPSVLRIIAKLRKQIARNNLEKIDLLLHQLGLTSLVNSRNPTPIEEAKNIIHICRNYYYNAIGDFYYALEKQYPELANPELVSLGFWPCGDRDGNPFVTYETTREVIDELRMTLMKCYYNELKLLNTKLTFKEVEYILQPLQARLYTCMFHPEQRIAYTEILEKLEDARKMLVEKYEGLYLKDLQKLIAKVKVFKNHFASLDIRQDHSGHVQTVEYLLKKSGMIQDSLSELSEEEMIKLLTQHQIDIPETLDGNPIVNDTIRNIAQLAALQEANGEAGCHRYIISNSEDIFSVLYVFGLMRWITNKEQFNFDIIPLFETMNGMAACQDIMDRLFSISAYQWHMERRKNRQTMMLGFSDGTKDGGYLKANWEIFRSKEKLTAVCRKHGMAALFFDGRGGPPARGGGKTHNFYAALGPTIANEEIQMTIQGQTITSTYGTPAKFKFNAEQMVTSGLLGSINQEDANLSPEDRKLIEELAELSYKKYTELKHHPRFLSYLEKMTTLKYYGKAHIGSRPNKRNADKKLTLKDLRAISYVGSWSQLKQNIPGYFGLGTAIAAFKANGKMEEVKDLYTSSPFFRTLIDNSMMALTKCFFELTSYMKANPEFSEFWSYLYEEYQLSKKMTLELTGYKVLMEKEEITRHSIQVREDIVLPLILIQNYALQKIQSNTDPDNRELYEKLVIRSLYGNINASRNSA
jgi:phosphoenolpyruvate carboxylase